MDIEQIIQDAGDERRAGTLSRLLKRFLEPAFGALPKGEVELIILDSLEEIGAVGADPQVYELVSKLKVTRSKARSLIYERELRRLTPDDLDARVKELMRRPLIHKSGNQFILEVENPLVSDHLRAKVQQLGHVSDGSFSPSIVKLPIDAVISLVESYLGDETEEVRQALIEAGAPNVSFRGVIKEMAKKLGSRLASDTGEAVMEKASEYMGPIIDGAIEQITATAQELFADNGNEGA